jgi:uncharacterized membrane protein YczE
VGSLEGILVLTIVGFTDFIYVGFAVFVGPGDGLVEGLKEGENKGDNDG